MDPGTALAVGSLSTKALLIIWKYYSDVKDAKVDIEYLVNEMQDLKDVLESVRKLLEGGSSIERIPTSVPLLSSTKSFQSDIEALTIRLDPDKGTRVMHRVGLRALKWPLKKKEVNEFVTKLQRYKATLNLAFAADQTKLVLNIKEDQTKLLLNIKDEGEHAKLPVAADANYNAYHRQHQGPCTADTRVELLQLLQAWATSHQKPIFWLSGMAGTGKSTIARTFAGSLDSQNRLGGTFFFSRGSGDLNNAVKFVSTLAHQLASRSPELKQLLCKAIADHSEVLRQGLRDQWKELIIKPLSMTQFDERPTLSLVIDALDECDSDDDVRLLLQLFVEVKELDAINLGIIVTSRPDMAIRLGFERMPEIVHVRLDLRDIERPVVEHDIRLFLEQELGRIRDERLIRDWPKEKDVQSLVQRSGCLFIYAATVCRFIGDYDWSPKERMLEILQSDSALGGDTPQLDEMYTQVLSRSLLGNGRKANQTKLVERFRKVVGVIVTSFDTLSILSLENLLSMPSNSIETALGSLHSVLDIPADPCSPIRLLHPSFRDFLIDEARCGDERFFIDQNLYHGKLVTSCLEALSTLTRNMGNLETPDSSPQEAQMNTLEKRLPKYMQYSCLYWAKHLELVNPGQRAQLGLCDHGKIQFFFQKHFLSWLEAMSLIGKMSEAVLVLYNLSAMLERHHHPALFADVEDAWRFALKNRFIIEQAPLQTYTSAVLFSPKNCAFRKGSVLPSWLIECTTVEENWGPLLQTFEHDGDHTGWSVALSFDGKFLACISGRSIRLWDPATGAVHSTLQGHADIVTSLDFSRDGYLASISLDFTVRLWDPITGVAHRILAFEIPSEWVGNSLEPSIAFAPDGNLAIVSRDAKLRLWDWKTGTISDTSILDFKVLTMAFLSDGRLIFLNRKSLNSKTELEREVMLYDPNDGTVQSVVSAPVYKIAVSIEHRLALGFRDGSILLHDLRTRSQTKLRFHRSEIASLSFSPDGRSLASVSLDGHLHLYDFMTCEDTPFEGNNHQSVIFSYDSKLLASTTRDTVQIWNPRTEAQTFPSKPNLEAESSITMMDFSFDGQQLACRYGDGTLQLRDLKSRLSQNIPNSRRVIAFSPNGSFLAFASNPHAYLLDIYPISIWDIATRSLHCALKGHSSRVRELAFSSDSKQVASGSQCGSINIWDVATGSPVSELEGNSHAVASIVFSPRNTQLASMDVEGKIRIWNTRSGSLQFTVGGQFSWDEGQTLAFSHSGDQLASSKGSEVCIWDPVKGSRLKIFDTERDIFQLSYSADGKYIETDIGEIELGEMQADGGALPPMPRNEWRLVNEWLVHGGRRVLWLPPEVRPWKLRARAQYEGLFALANPVGKITFIQVDPYYSPAEEAP